MIFKKIKGYFRKKKEFMDGVEIIDLGVWDEFFEHGMINAQRNMDRDLKNMKNKTKKRIPIQPLDIIHDLEIGVTFPKEKVKEAIRELKKRIEFTKEHLGGNVRDDKRAIDMLEARLLHPKYGHLFLWKTTTPEHINKLLKKYELDHKDIRDYMRSIPALAVTCMQRYVKVLEKVSDEKPTFTIIAPPKYFKDPKNYSDPILLARSPFGNFYYILTAWDKEIGMVSELLDGEELVIDKNGNGKIKPKKK